MIGLDYFLDEKWLKKNVSKLGDKKFTSTLPATVSENFKWTLKENFFDDKLLYDYIHAYRNNISSETEGKFKYLEIISILSLDGNLQSKDPYSLVRKLDQLNKGAKPSSYDEKLLMNVLQVYDLIYQNNFVVNEENFELIVHILYRNIGYDLDIKDSYKRNANSKTVIKNLLSPALIDAELKNMWEYISKPKPYNFSGFTEAMMLGLEIIYISPFDSLNLVLAQFVVKWYLFQLNQSFKYMSFNYLLGVNFEEFITILDKTFSGSFELDKYFQLIRKSTKAETNMIWKAEWLFKEAEKRKELNKLFNNLKPVTFMTRLLSIQDRTFNITTIKKNLFYKDKLLNKVQIDKYLEEFISLGIISKKKNKNSNVYQFIDPKFKKINQLLKD